MAPDIFLKQIDLGQGAPLTTNGALPMILVADCNHANPVDFVAVARTNLVGGFILKATEGTGFTGLLERRTGVTKTRLIEELARIAFADIRKAVEWHPEIVVREGEEGEEPTRVLVSRVLVKDSAEIIDDTAAAIASVSQGANGVMRVQMHSRVDALEKLARILNHYKEPAPVNVDLRPVIDLIGRPDTPPAS
jgi:Terminase small subunit